MRASLKSHIFVINNDASKANAEELKESIAFYFAYIFFSGGFYARRSCGAMATSMTVSARSARGGDIGQRNGGEVGISRTRVFVL